MAYKHHFTCRKSSLFMVFMLLLQFSFLSSRSQSDNYDFSRVTEWLSENITALGGRAVIVIYKDGKLIYNHSENELSRRQKAVGKMIARRKGKDADELLKDFNSNSKGMIASCSKWLSAALVMTFIDDGSLKIEDSIGRYLPGMTANGKGTITIWQCLSHLTGIKAGSIRESTEALKNIQSMDEAIEMIANQPMEGFPGKTFHYSSTGLQIAAAVIEKISGKNFETLFAERIAVPCNMLNTDFGLGKVAMPAGGGRSTAADYLNFLSMILNDGVFNGRQVLSESSVIEMQKNRVGKDTKIISSPAEAGGWGYGYGEWVMDSPPQTVLNGEILPKSERSFGVTSPGLFGSFPWIDRKLNYAGFLFTFNLKNKGRGDLYRSLKNIVDAAITKK